MGRGVADAQLRVWAPQGAQVLFVRQVAPTIEDLTARRTPVSELIARVSDRDRGETSPASITWPSSVPAKQVGSEQLAARVQLHTDGQQVAQGLVKAIWSDDDALTTRINPAVAHYTGQTELAAVIQDGLAASAAGDDDTATIKLGRALELAKETGNDEATDRLLRVVELGCRRRHGAIAS